MKLLNKLTPVALATAVAMGGLAVPSVASAELSATVGAANMYFWRGQNLTPSGGQVSGSLDYSHSSGAYAGVWTTTETDGHETDLYVGYAGEVAGFSYDVSYWEYLYPEDGAAGDSLADDDLSEVVVGLGYGPVALTVYSANDANGGSDYTYMTFDYTYEKFGIQYGTWDYDLAGNNEYSHLTLSYAATDELTFMISQVDNDVPDTDADAIEDNPLFVVSYSKTFDL